MSKMEISSGGANNNKSKSIPIVAIGASAGGIQAVTELLQNLSSDTEMAYVYVQHLDPNYESKLSDILSKYTSMKVLEARHLLHIEKNHLYIIPSTKDISITDGVLLLNNRAESGSLHMPIDQFFVSVAEKHKKGAIGILLSGSANDGTLGLRAIKYAGGLTFAQDDSAQFQSMPKSAIAEGVVDKVLSPKEIAHELQMLSHQTDVIVQAMQETEEATQNIVDEDIIAIIQLLRKSEGMDFTHYKMNTIKRRIIRRMLLFKLKTISSYFNYLKDHAAEVKALYNDLLINVTSFFRDPDTLEYIKKAVISRIIKSTGPDEPIRIWVPACSTGEEAYSIAMLFTEVLGDKTPGTAIQIFATDLSEMTIAKARLGIYTRNEVANVSPKRIQRFFSKIEGNYRIIKTIRDMCVFAPHNIFRDPPFSRIDLISCCNLMIYLDTILQKKILSTFHYSLNPDGFLVLGKSETVSSANQLFSQIEKKFKVYTRKKGIPARAFFETNYRLPEAERMITTGIHQPGQKASDSSAGLERMVDSILLNKYIPASVVVNNELEILQFRGATGLYLEPSPGKASLNLLKMARPGLAFELRNTVHKVSKTGQPVKRPGLEIAINNVFHQVSIEVSPLKSEGEEKLYLIVFENALIPDINEIKNAHSKDKLVKQLEEELKLLKEDMRSIIEEQEANNEELQSANEEVVSSNEELQSINEELETSKEELESSNEELLTINTELQMRNDQLAEAYEYAEAVFETIREAILVLDKDLRIKSASKSFYSIFKMREEEVEGMLIFELANRQWEIPKLRELLTVLLPKNNQCFDFELTHTFPSIGEKILMINACKVFQRIHRQQIILLAIEDITDLLKKQV